MFGKIKKLISNIKTLIILLIILIVVGWSLAIYLGIKVNNIEKRLVNTYQDKIEKLNYYSNLLDKSLKLVRENKGLEVLEEDIRLLDNGSLLAEWENVVFGGNKEEDVNNYIDIIIDSLKFFSK